MTLSLEFGPGVSGARCAVISAPDPNPEDVDCKFFFDVPKGVLLDISKESNLTS